MKFLSEELATEAMTTTDETEADDLWMAAWEAYYDEEAGR